MSNSSEETITEISANGLLGNCRRKPDGSRQTTHCGTYRNCMPVTYAASKYRITSILILNVSIATRRLGGGQMVEGKLCEGCKYRYDPEELVDGLCFDCRVKEIRDERRELRGR